MQYCRKEEKTKKTTTTKQNPGYKRCFSNLFSVKDKTGLKSKGYGLNILHFLFIWNIVLWRASLLSPFQFVLCTEEDYFLCLTAEMTGPKECETISSGQVQGISSLRVYCREQE